MATAEHYSRLRRGHAIPPTSIFRDLNYMGAPYVEPVYMCHDDETLEIRSADAVAIRNRSRSRESLVSRQSRGTKSAIYGTDGDSEFGETNERMPKAGRRSRKGHNKTVVDQNESKDRNSVVSSGITRSGFRNSKRYQKTPRQTPREVSQKRGRRPSRGSTLGEDGGKVKEDQSKRSPSAKLRDQLKLRLDSAQSRPRQQDKESAKTTARSNYSRKSKRPASKVRKNEADAQSNASKTPRDRNTRRRGKSKPPGAKPEKKKGAPKATDICQSDDPDEVDTESLASEPAERTPRGRRRTRGSKNKLGLYKRRIPSLQNLDDPTLEYQHCSHSRSSSVARSIAPSMGSRESSPPTPRYTTIKSRINRAENYIIKTKKAEDQKSITSTGSRRSVARSVSSDRKQRGWELPPIRFNTAPLPRLHMKEKASDDVTADDLEDIRRKVTETLNTYYSKVRSSQVDTAKETWDALLPGNIPTPHLKKAFSKAFWTYSPEKGEEVLMQPWLPGKGANGTVNVAGRHGVWTKGQH